MTKDEELKMLRRFRARIEEAHEEHLRTGDYVPLGMAAQDALVECSVVVVRSALAKLDT